MQKRDTEIQRIQEFLKTYEQITPTLRNLTTHSYKYYKDKLREFMVREGLNPHPYPEERI